MNRDLDFKSPPWVRLAKYAREAKDFGAVRYADQIGYRESTITVKAIGGNSYSIDSGVDRRVFTPAQTQPFLAIFTCMAQPETWIDVSVVQAVAVDPDRRLEFLRRRIKTVREQAEHVSPTLGCALRTAVQTRIESTSDGERLFMAWGPDGLTPNVTVA